MVKVEDTVSSISETVCEIFFAAPAARRPARTSLSRVGGGCGMTGGHRGPTVSFGGWRVAPQGGPPGLPASYRDHTPPVRDGENLAHRDHTLTLRYSPLVRARDKNET